MALMPVLAANLTEDNPVAAYHGKCFESIEFELFKTSDSTFDVKMHARGPKSLTCSDMLLFANTELMHFEPLLWRGPHKLSFEMTSPEAIADFGYGGIKIFDFCDGITKETESLWNFIKTIHFGTHDDHPAWPFIGSHIPMYVQEATAKMIEETMGWKQELRTQNLTWIDPGLIQSGDFLAVTRMVGLGAIIMYGSGAHISHSLMALRFDGELYILESVGPVPGVRRTKFSEWIEMA